MTKKHQKVHEDHSPVSNQHALSSGDLSTTSTDDNT